MWSNLLAALRRAGGWLSRNWMWVLLPIGILLVVWRLLQGRTVISPSLLQAGRVEDQARDTAAQESARAEAERRKRSTALVQEYEASVTRLTEEQKEKVEMLQDDPQALNSFLLDVGKKVRASNGP